MQYIKCESDNRPAVASFSKSKALEVVPRLDDWLSEPDGVRSKGHSSV